MKSVLHSSPFFIVSRMWFLLVRPFKLVSGPGSATVLHRLFLVFPSRRGHKARPQTGFHFTVQKRPGKGSSGASLAKRPHLESRTETHPDGKKSGGGSVSASCADARKGGGHGISTPDVSQSTSYLLFLSLVLQVGMPSHFLDQWGSIASNKFVLNIV